MTERGLRYIFARILSAATRLETSTSTQLTLTRLGSWKPTRGEKAKYSFMLFMATFSMFMMKAPGFPLKLGIPIAYVIVILLPITSQFFLPASPIFLWLLFFYSSQFIPATSRPHIWVSVLPTLETVWFGASISDILTRVGNPALDILAWLPYGVVHFVAPFVVAACLFVFAPPGATKFFGAAFGFMNLYGVMIQVGFPCAPPWYELREGLTPANYTMKGSPAGLARIDELFGGHGYTISFTNAPVPFGAFPSLHSGCATMEALFCSYFFPLALELPLPGLKSRLKMDARILYWMYAFWLYWCTMYLMHHFLVDLVGGGCLATACFYYFLPEDIRTVMEQRYAYKPSAPAPLSAAPPSEYPREGFGTRSSVDLASAARAGLRMEAGKVNNTNGHAASSGGGGGGPPHVLFDTDDTDEGENGGAAADESNDWGNSDEESSSKKPATTNTKITTTNNGR